MSLRFLDSFDHYTTILQKWTTVGSGQSISAAAARTGAQGLYHGGGGAVSYSTLTLDNKDTWIIGFAYRVSVIQVVMLCETQDIGSSQGRLKLNVDGTLSVQRSTTTLATSTKALMANIFYYIEFKHIVADVNGTLEVRVDGEVWVTFTGDTKATANASANGIALCNAGAIGSNQSFDDLYILDGVDQSIADPNSPPNNNYLGDTQVQALVPVGAGAYAELATLVGAPTHWQAEDEVPPDEDTSYVEDAVVDVRDTFAMTNLAVVSATIPGIQILTRARKTAAGAASFARMYRNAAADNQGADTVLQESYAYHREILGGDPIAAGAWTVPNINSLEMGFRTR